LSDFQPVGLGIKEDEAFQRIREAKSEVTGLFDAFEENFDASDRQIQSWRKVLDRIDIDPTNKVVRVSVVGAVKAGKSTFGNYFLGEDLLRRGAGVITAVVTRVLSGTGLQAKLRLKGLKEVQHEVLDALQMLDPAEERFSFQKFRFDRGEDRAQVRSFLAEISSREESSDELMGQSSLLRAYLDGFEELQDILKAEESEIQLVGEEVTSHRDFVGRESRAIYLREALLTVPVKRLPRGVEIGDCQGTDSANPAHLAAVLEYLLESHFVIYLISSRTGIREADVKLIQALKSLQLSNHVFFVFNLDIGEHEGKSSVIQQIQRNESELRALGLGSNVYAFSVLYHLFNQMDERRLSGKDKLRMALWEEDQELIAFSAENEAGFRRDFDNLIDKERYELQINKANAALSGLTRGMKEFLEFRETMVGKSKAEMEESARALRTKQSSIRDTPGVVRNALDGIKVKMNGDIRRDVDQFFDSTFGTPVTTMLSLISSFDPGVETSETTSGVSRSLVVFYRKLAETLQRHVQEVFNLKLIEFAKKRVAGIREEYLRGIGSYLQVLDQLFENYAREMKAVAPGFSSRSFQSAPTSSSTEWKPKIFNPAFHFHVKARAEVFLRIGWGKTSEGVRVLARKILKKDPGEQRDRLSKIELSGQGVIRKCIEEELLAQLSDYRENLKYGFFLKASDMISDELFKEIEQYIEENLLDFTQMEDLIRSEGEGKSEEAAVISRLSERVGAVERLLPAGDFRRGSEEK
jgi:hypothetical protein